MPYSSDSDLLKEFSNSELALLSGDENGLIINVERTTQARENADTLINAYLYGLYDLPFAIVPALVKSISIDLTIHQLYGMQNKETFIPVPILDRKLNAMNSLIKIQKGQINFEGKYQPEILSNIIKQTQKLGEICF